MDELQVKEIIDRLILEPCYDMNLNFKLDEIYFEQAAEAVICTEMCSVSLIQRKLKVGYVIAENLIMQLGVMGIVGKNERSKCRDVLIKNMTDFKKLIQMTNLFDKNVLIEFNLSLKNYLINNKKDIEIAREKVNRYSKYGRYD